MLNLSCPSCVALSLVLMTSLVQADDPVQVGNRRELFVDRLLIDKLDNARLSLHTPRAQEIVLKFNKPWKGMYSGYETVLRDGDKLMLYCRGLPISSAALGAEVTCVAESRDGVHWTRPELGLFEVHGTKANNVVLANHGACHNFARSSIESRTARQNRGTRHSVAADHSTPKMTSCTGVSLLTWS